MMKLYINKLEEALKSDAISNDIKKTISIFLEAVNDWPYEVSNLEDYELDIKNFISATPTKQTLESVIENIDMSKYAWESESLAQIISIFEYYENDMSLSDIIKDLKVKLKSVF